MIQTHSRDELRISPAAMVEWMPRCILWLWWVRHRECLTENIFHNIYSARNVYHGLKEDLWYEYSKSNLICVAWLQCHRSYSYYQTYSRVCGSAYFSFLFKNLVRFQAFVIFEEAWRKTQKCVCGNQAVFCKFCGHCAIQSSAGSGNCFNSISLWLLTLLYVTGDSSSACILVPFAFSLLSFGFCLGFSEAGFGDRNSLLTLCIKQSPLQCPCSGPQARGWITLSPTAKAILAVSSKVFFPVAGYFTFHLLGLLVTWPLSKPCPTFPVARDTVSIAPVSAFWPGLGGFVFLFLVFPSSDRFYGDESD